MISVPALRVISLGWGIQSWALAALEAVEWVSPSTWQRCPWCGQQQQDGHFPGVAAQRPVSEPEPDGLARGFAGEGIPRAIMCPVSSRSM